MTTPVERVTDTLTGAWERRNLPRLAAALPPWVLPDHLTALGLLATVSICAAYVLTRLHPGWLWLASAGFVLHWFADSLDGTLARVRRRERRRYGHFVDHVSDAFTCVAISVGLAASPHADARIALLFGVGYLLMSVYAQILVVTTGVFRLSYSRLGPTEVRLLFIVMNTVTVLWQPSFRLAGRSVTFVEAVLVLMTASLFATFVAAAVRDGRRLEKEDRPEP